MDNCVSWYYELIVRSCYSKMYFHMEQQHKETMERNCCTSWFKKVYHFYLLVYVLAAKLFICSGYKVKLRQHNIHRFCSEILKTEFIFLLILQKKNQLTTETFHHLFPRYQGSKWNWSFKAGIPSRIQAWFWFKFCDSWSEACDVLYCGW